MAYRTRVGDLRAEVSRSPRDGDRLAVAFVRLSALPAVVLVAWLLVAIPLLLVDALRPLPALLLFLPVAAVLWTVAWRLTERVSTHAFSEPAPPWTLWALLGVAVIFTLGHGLLHA